VKLAGPSDKLEPYLTQIELLSEHPIKLEQLLIQLGDSGNMSFAVLLSKYFTPHLKGESSHNLLLNSYLADSSQHTSLLKCLAHLSRMNHSPLFYAACLSAMMSAQQASLIPEDIKNETRSSQKFEIVSQLMQARIRTVQLP
jgi:hypothetical protein